jgi:hypothetical protein
MILTNFYQSLTRHAIVAILAISICFSSAASASATSYDEAKRISRKDATDTTHRDWYLGQMRPAFRQLFEPLLQACAASTKATEPPSFGLVFVVSSSGLPGRLFWREHSDLTRCLEEGIRRMSFPPAPKNEFYFGLEVAAPVASV